MYPLLLTPKLQPVSYTLQSPPELKGNYIQLIEPREDNFLGQQVGQRTTENELCMGAENKV